MKNNKGFTLIELIAVLIVLVLIFALVYVNVTRMMDNGKGAIYEAEKTLVFSATDEYLEAKENLYPANSKNKYCITFDQLINYGLITENEITHLDKGESIEVTYDSEGNPKYDLGYYCSQRIVNAHIELNGNKTVTLNQQKDGSVRKYTEAGFKYFANNSSSGTNKSFTLTTTSSISGLVVKVKNNKTDLVTTCSSSNNCLNETVTGVFTIMYEYTYSGATYTAERTVKIKDNEAPVITNNFPSVVLSDKVTSYDVKDGISVTDNSGETIKVTATSNLKLGQLGTYTITYKATDSSGNTATSTRTVTIVSGDPATLTVTPAKVDIQLNGSYPASNIMDGVSAETVDGKNLIDKVTYKIRRGNKDVASIDTSVVGSNVITYTLVDDLGNTLTSTRTVNVVKDYSVLKAYSSSSTNDFHSDDYREKIYKINFLKNATIPSNPIVKWDLSADGDNSITGWLEYYPNSTTYYTMNITSNYQIYAPTNFGYWFYKLSNVTEISFNNLKTDLTTNMEGVFFNCKYLGRIDGISSWNTSNVTDMSNMFNSTGYEAPEVNIDLSKWVTSKVKSMTNMFRDSGYRSATWSVGDLSKWDTSNVTNMSQFFSNAGFKATTWNVGDIGNWDTSNVTNMHFMFDSAGYSDTTWSLDLSKWDVSNVADMYSMFGSAGYNATTWTVGDLSNWDTSNVTTMYCMFTSAGRNATSWTIGDLSKWDVSNVTTMYYMFSLAGYNAITWDIGNIGDWNISKVKSLDSTFDRTGYNATTWNIGNLSKWDTSNVKNMHMIFYNAGRKATTWDIGDLSKWNTSRVTTMAGAFTGIGAASTSNITLNFSGWDTSKVTNMEMMFYGATKISEIYVGSKWTTKNVTNSSSMFYGLTKLPNYNSSYVDKTKAYVGGYLTCASGQTCTCTTTGC